MARHRPNSIGFKRQIAQDVLSYLARYTHRVAIANSRLLAFDGTRVSFKWKDYRRQGEARYVPELTDVAASDDPLT